MLFLPALVTFTDGRYVGAILDRNGLRPSRYYLTEDDQVIMASEVGVVDISKNNIKLKVNIESISFDCLIDVNKIGAYIFGKHFHFQARLRPGRMLLVDTQEHTFLRDDAVKVNIAIQRPLEKWLEELVE